MKPKTKKGMLKFGVTIVLAIVLIYSFQTPVGDVKEKIGIPLGGEIVGTFGGLDSKILFYSLTTIKEVKSELITILVLASTTSIGGLIGSKKASGGTCNVYQAATNSNRCELCQANPFFDCTEYACRALGQDCEYVDEEARCIKDLEGSDITPPQIEECFSKDALKDEDENDIKTQHTDGVGCRLVDEVSEFEVFAIKLVTDEESQCRMGAKPGFSFEDEGILLGNDAYTLNHYYIYSIGETENTPLDGCKAGQSCNFYIKCEDRWGNLARRDYRVQFSLQEGVDVNPPTIVRTIVDSGSKIRADLEEVNFEMYVYDQTGVKECRWSQTDHNEYLDFENFFECENELTPERGGQLCKSKLTEIEAGGDTTYYFRCIDSSKQSNENRESFEFTLQSTTPLTVSKVELPKDGGKQLENEQRLYVITEREAECVYILDGSSETVKFELSDGLEHIHELRIDDGDHTLEVQCTDAAGNQQTYERTFVVAKDKTGPKVIRMYREPGYFSSLIVVLDEPAICKYSLTKENFEYSDEDVQFMLEGEYDITHSAFLEQGAVYHILCKDQKDNLGPRTHIYT